MPSRQRSTATRFLFRALAVCLSLTVALVMAELILRVIEKHRLASRLDYGDAVAERVLGAGGLLELDLDAELTDDMDRTVRWTTNSAGFRNDDEVDPVPAPGTVRVLTLGNSFAAGFRVDQEKTFGRRLERWLDDRCGGAEVLISMIEEPATGLYYMAHQGQGFSPQIVLLGITLGNDIAQTYLSLDPAGEYALRVEDPEVHIERLRPRGTTGFRHGLEDRVMPGTCLRSRNLSQKALWFA